MRPSGPTLLLLAAVGVILLVGDGSAAGCERKAMVNFDADKYLGKWYVVARYGDDPKEEGGECITVEYTLAGINNVTVHNRMFNTHEVDFKDEFGWATLVSLSSRNSTFEVHFTKDAGKENRPYTVLDTDYVNYAIVWACSLDETTNMPVEILWILSRNASYTPEQKSKMGEKLALLGLELNQFKEITQDQEKCIVTKCKKKPFPEFDAMKYMGVWYEIARFGETDFDNGGQCITTEYTLSGINNMTIHSRMYTTSEGTFTDRVGWGTFADSTKGKLEVHHPEVTEPYDYWVLDTDYGNYSIVWACSEPKSKDKKSSITETSWILSRTAQLTPEQNQTLTDKLHKNGLWWSLYRETPQDPQQCVPKATCNKPALTDFNILEYLGVWYEIARFGEVPFEQDGQCVTQQFVATVGSNFTVHINMSTRAAGGFDHLVGWAKLDDPDSGEGKLTVHFPGIAETRYWVLDTNYNYSIVWSCESADGNSNITEASWILSRNPQLTPEQEQQVNEKLEEKDLSWSRYTKITQDTNQCVASDSPDNHNDNTGCNKTALNEFSVNKYQGVWYEIARFGEVPFKEDGLCITEDYETTGEILIVRSKMFTKAAGEFNEIIGWAEFDDHNSREAKLTVHFESLPAIPYWVLDTDYESYSIVWSCSDPTDETSKNIEASWILSRNPQLTPEQEQQVNAKLEKKGLSWSRYTKTTQDTNKCVASDRPDDDNTRCNKSALNEFSVNKYLGVWYEIARFGEVSFEQGGQCVTAEYLLAGDNNVTVHNRVFNKAAGAFIDIIGWAELDDPTSAVAKMAVHLPGVPGPTPYWVLDTDYVNYSIVWACSDPTGKASNNTETSWVLSRTSVMSEEVSRQVEASLLSLGLARSRYTDTPQEQKGCRQHKGSGGVAAAMGRGVVLALAAAVALFST